jgi:hypothetical protein
MKFIKHLTMLTGHVRSSPRSEVDQRTIDFIRGSLTDGSGALGATGWAVLRIDAPPGGFCFDLSMTGNEVARCWLATTAAAADAMWLAAQEMPRLPGVNPGQPSLPWLAVGLLPDGMKALRSAIPIGQLGDLERCVAWALLPDA